MTALHFSTLREMALSAAHMKHALDHGTDATRLMRLGTIVHELVLGPRHGKSPVAVFEGTRRGKAWEAFEASHKDTEIVTIAEWDEASAMANAIKADATAMSLIAPARYELPLAWEDGGIPCATDGIDIVGPDYIADLKMTSCTEPDRFGAHAARMHYHAQCAWYETGARANGLTVRNVYLIGVESTPPYVVTCMRLTTATLAQGRKSYTLWLERYRSCRDSDHWPGYVQSIVDFDLPVWAGGEDTLTEEDMAVA